MKNLEVSLFVVLICGVVIAGVMAIKPKSTFVPPVPIQVIVATTTTPTHKASGISGTVLLGPTCPVMRDPPDPQCADKPYQTSLEVTTLDGTRVIARFNSDTQGKFKVNTPPGEYTIRSVATTNFYPRCSGNGSVIVKTGSFTYVPVSCDTGIR